MCRISVSFSFSFLFVFYFMSDIFYYVSTVFDTTYNFCSHDSGTGSALLAFPFW